MPSRLDRYLPGLFMGLGVIMASLVPVLGHRSEGAVLMGFFLMALAVLCADTLEQRRYGQPARPSPAALILAGACILAGLILDDSSKAAEYLPVMGAVAWSSLLSGRRNCKLKPTRAA